MNSKLNSISFLTNHNLESLEIENNSSNKIFDDGVIDYLDSLSKLLFKDARIKEYPDVGTFAFYCRKSNILKILRNYSEKLKKRFGRGLVFHVAPSNVPVNFAYSLISGLLSGNSNIVRVPSKNFEQVKIIVDAINYLSENNFKELSKKIVLIRYHNEEIEITKKLSIICDVRVVWGGDETINQIRRNPLKPKSFDITFSDRYSICVLDAHSISQDENLDKLVRAFYNDTYLFDQNACTSPHLVVWLGNEAEVSQSKDIFWQKLHSLVKNQYNLQPVQAMDKITTFYQQSIQLNDISLTMQDNYLWRINLKELDQSLDHFRGNSGYFAEYHASSLNELSGVINPKYQTLSYYGIKRDKLENFLAFNNLHGVDRIVPVGRTMDFSLIWDGYDLINQLSREVEII